MALPSGYTRVEYIESSGTQCLDMGFVGKTGMKFVGKFMALSSSDLSNSDLVLAALGPSALRYYPLAFDAGKFGYGYRSFYTSNTTAAINKEYEFEAEFLSGAQKLTINGNVVKSSANTSDITTSTYNLYLFGANNANSPMGLGSYRMWPLQTYYNGTLFSDIIPCINAAGEVGMWDDVNGVFRGNVGSGSFKAGPVVVTGPQGSRTLLDAVDYQIKTGNTMIDAVTYIVTQGKVMVDGVVYTIGLKEKEPDVEYVTVKITGNGVYTSLFGDKTSCSYLSINGNTYQSTTTIEVPVGTACQCYIRGAGGVVMCGVYLNNSMVAKAASNNNIQGIYTYTITKPVTITLEASVDPYGYEYAYGNIRITE